MVLFCPSSTSKKAENDLQFDAALVTNSGSSQPITSRRIEGSGERRCGGISNGIDGREVDGLGSRDPWTKVTIGQGLLAGILEKRAHLSPLNEDDTHREQELIEELMSLLG